MQHIAITNDTLSLTKRLSAGCCNTFMTRLKGLMFTRGIAEDAGLLFFQEKENRIDAAIHMFFVGYDIGVVWLNCQKRVVDTRLAKSWRPFYMPGKPALYILEIHPRRLAEFRVGDQVAFENPKSH